MPKVFKARGVKAEVVEQVRRQAQAVKAEILGDA
jgi:hypothetical protein